MVTPEFSLFSLTYACNNRCKWCYASPENYAPRTMSLADAKGFIGLCHSLKMKDIGFLGGEPTLVRGLEGLIRFAADKGIRVTLYTNGRGLSDPGFARRLKDSGVFCINVGVQSDKAEEHDAVTGAPGSFAETLEGIRNCSGLGIEIRILTVVSHPELSRYTRIIDRFREYTGHFVFFRELPDVLKYSEQAMLPNRVTAGVVRGIFLHALKRGVNVSLYTRMPMCWFRRADAEEMVRAGSLMNFCHVAQGLALNIGPEGMVTPCVNMAGIRMMDLKKGGAIIGRDEFLKEWNSRRLDGTRKMMRRFRHGACSRCSFSGPLCSGGCPLVKFELGPYWKDYQNIRAHRWQGVRND